ncbi:MAG: hypothetical protein ACXVZV_11405 [Terriglobales bacterium]
MKKSLILLVVLFLTTGLIAQTNASKKTKEDRWQGHIVRINQSESTIDVRGGQKNMDQTEKRIHYDSSTEWTKQGKPADMSEFKDGSFVIALGHNDDKGVFHATRIDLRLPR